MSEKDRLENDLAWAEGDMESGERVRNIASHFRSLQAKVKSLQSSNAEKDEKMAGLAAVVEDSVPVMKHALKTLHDINWVEDDDQGDMDKAEIGLAAAIANAPSPSKVLAERDARRDKEVAAKVWREDAVWHKLCMSGYNNKGSEAYIHRCARDFSLAKASALSAKPDAKEGEPCDHPGCKSHVSHPCEGCGRQWGGPAAKEGG